jgi:signal transduction histidine kinase
MVGARSVGPAMSALLRPWRDVGRLWRALVHVTLSVPIGGISFAFVVTLAALSLGLLITFLLALPVIWLLFTGGHVLAGIERGRHSALLDLELADPVRPPAAPTFFGRLGERARSKPRWRELGHLVLLLPLGLVTGGVAGIAWFGSAALLALPAYVSALPGDTAKLWLFEVGQGPAALLAATLGAAGLVLAAPWATLAMAEAQAAVARKLLGPDAQAELEGEVTRLETSRRAAVEGAEDERRRIERDLHDGAQQRLVALAAGLGAAREKLRGDPEAEAMVAEAHEEAKAALRELRDLVRGIHPVILEDRGLDAALSAVVARSPVPVRLEVAVDERPPPAVESAAYFVVSEALANVAAHSGATEAAVAIARAGGRLVVEVRDDGAGGADPARGTGLDGLRTRVEALGGVLYVISPPGGPTTVLAELPCGS